MGSENDKKPPVFSPRLGEDELGRILDLKELEDHKSPVGTFAARYRKLGWELSVLDTSQGTVLPVDFHQSQDVWSQQLADFEAQGLAVGLGVHTGARSQLFVLEIAAGESDLILERLGHWQAECVAQRSDNLERHFYALPAGCLLPTTSIRHDSLITVYGEGSWVVTPPAAESPDEDPWRWLIPPWATPLRPPQPALWRFLKEHLPETVDAIAPPEAAIPPWEEIYPLVSPRAAILQTLLAPAESPEEYYDNLLEAALQEGFKDPSLLLGLLWHAPHGDALQRPERWDYLLDLVAAAMQSGRESGSPLGEPLAGFGERMVIERHRYETILLELRQLSSRAAELEQQLAEWAHSFGPEHVPADDRPAPGLDQLDSHPLGFLHDWTDLEHQVSALVEKFLPDAELPEDQEALLESFSAYQAGAFHDIGDAIKKQTQQSRQVDEVDSAIQACLDENPDLAQDQRKVEMLYYCLKNYVNFHPDLMGLPIQERVAEASRMARDFLGEPLKNNL
jgi:Bifunctional DNA primase/polymerase, N-terminal